jgi:hypothetical protein
MRHYLNLNLEFDYSFDLELVNFVEKLLFNDDILQAMRQVLH